VVALWYAIAPVAFGERQAADFHFNYYYAAEAIRAGEDFYPTDGFVVRGPDDLIIDYVYPPLLGVATVPWTLVPVGLAEVLFQILLVGFFVATLALLGVRDWRCYGLAFLWPPVTDAITTGNVTIVLGFAAALTWRYRDRPLAAGASVGISVATKLFMWPLAVWLAASRRHAAAAWSVAIAVAAALASWAVVGFPGIADYPDPRSSPERPHGRARVHAVRARRRPRRLSGDRSGSVGGARRRAPRRDGLRRPARG
jgi:hypothetical protein